jgi:hypothetical protein
MERSPLNPGALAALTREATRAFGKIKPFILNVRVAPRIRPEPRGQRAMT